MGSHNHGQGHETVFGRDCLRTARHAAERIRFVNGDTDLVTHGRGTIGSRSMMAAGGALVSAAERIIARGKRIAAHLIEAAEEDIEFTDGVFRVAGTDRGIGIEELARRSYVPGALPMGEDLGLSALLINRPGDATFPNGCHVCEVEIDPETGETELLSYVVVDDVGTVINPLLVKGQIHGGIAQGLGQAFGESVRYDEAGQIQTASFMDYAMPRAADLCAMTVLSNPVPTATNPLGAKGAGEAGTVGALPVLLGAVVDALRPLGVTHLDLPATPERIWAAIREAQADERNAAS